MKVSIRRWLGFAALPAALLMLGLSSPAHAKVPSNIPNATHACDNDPNPLLLPVFTRSENNPENGNIIIHRTDGQDCDLSAADINATGQIFILVENGGKINIPNAQNIRSLSSNVFLYSTENDVLAPNSDIKADLLVNIEAGVETDSAVGTIRAKDVISNLANIMLPSFNGDANILIRAQKDVFVKKVKTTGTLGVTSNRSGNVQIDANLHSSNNGDMSIRVGGNIEEIDIRSLTGGTDGNGNPNPRRNEIGVRITNGGPSSTGNLSVPDLNAIKVQQSQSRSGLIELNTQKGELTLGAGTLNTSSQNDFGGGNIYLFAEKIITTGDVTLDNSQSKNAPNISRQIVIAASHIDFSQSTRFSILSDGNGISNSEPATVYVLPQGGIIPNVANDVQNLLWNYSFNGGFFNLDKPLHFDGGETADLNITADGNAVQIAITGHPIIFDGKNVQIQSKGNHNIGKHEIVMGYFGPSNGGVGIDFGNTEKTEFFVRGQGSGASGGDIQVQTTDIILSSVKNLNFKANGPQTQPGDGGTIFFLAPDLAASNTIMKFDADASVNGTGNAQINRFSGFNRKAIFFDAGLSAVTLGKKAGMVQMTANGGGAGGDGGAIQVNSSVIDVFSTLSVEASAGTSGNGKGGMIELSNLLTNNPPNIAFRAKGNGTGEGGEFKINSLSQTLDITHSVVVKGGPNLTTSDGKMGSIELNGVKCQAYKVRPGNTYPKQYWKCSDPDSPTTLGNSALEAFDDLGQLKADIEDRDTELFLWQNSGDLNSFFLQNTQTGLAGYTFPLDNNAQSNVNIYVGVFMQVNGGNLNSDQVKSATAHELGHGADFTKGIVAPLESETTIYKRWADNDVVYLDDLSPGVPRPPCVAVNGVTAPFDGVFDEFTDQPICPGGQLDPKFAGLANSQILILASRAKFIATPAPQSGTNEWNEPYAQAFSFVTTDSQDPLKAINFTYSGVMSNGYFACGREWAAAVNSKQSVPPAEPAGFTCN